MWKYYVPNFMRIESTTKPTNRLSVLTISVCCTWMSNVITRRKQIADVNITWTGTNYTTKFQQRGTDQVKLSSTTYTYMSGQRWGWEPPSYTPGISKSVPASTKNVFSIIPLLATSSGWKICQMKRKYICSNYQNLTYILTTKAPDLKRPNLPSSSPRGPKNHK